MILGVFPSVDFFFSCLYDYSILLPFDEPLLPFLCYV